MPTVYNLRAQNNATFHWTRDLSTLAAVYDLSTATIRMQIRTTPDAPDPAAYEWCSDGLAAGGIFYNSTTHLAVFAAPQADMGALEGSYVYDCRIEFSSGDIVIFGGALTMGAGVTRHGSGAGYSSVGDTVTVDGERAAAPVPLPVSFYGVIGGGVVTTGLNLNPINALTVAALH